MQAHGVFFSLVMLLAMSNPQVTLFLPWHKLTFTQRYPNRLAFTMSMLSLLWENAPQMSVQALAATRETTDVASTLSVLVSVIVAIVSQLLLSAEARVRDGPFIRRKVGMSPPFEMAGWPFCISYPKVKSDLGLGVRHRTEVV